MSFLVMVQGARVLKRIRVHAGHAFLQCTDHLASCGLMRGFCGSQVIKLRLFLCIEECFIKQLTSPIWLGFQFQQKNSKILLYISVEEEPGPCPKIALLFLNCSSFFSYPFLSLISNSLNMPFGTRNGHGACVKPISYKQETGETERLLCPGTPQSPAQFQKVLYITKEKPNFHKISIDDIYIIKCSNNEYKILCSQFSQSVQSLSRVRLFATP